MNTTKDESLAVVSRQYVVQVCVHVTNPDDPPYPVEQIINHTLLMALRRAQKEQFQQDWIAPLPNLAVLSVRTIGEDK